MEAIRAQRAVDITARQLRQEILRGTWSPGALLPPERQLATELGVNRLTLRAALSRLEAENLISPHQGRGIQVQDWRASGSLDLLVHQITPDDLNDLFLLRRTLAAEATSQACIHAEPEHLDILNQILQRQRHEEDPQRFFDGDLLFTRTLVEASGSLPLRLLFNTLERILRAHPTPTLAMLQDRPSARASYAALLALVRSRNADLTRRAILQTLRDEDHAALAALLS